MSSIKELQKEWYEILKQNDFIDIEDTSVTGFEIGPLANGSGHPLKVWTGISIDYPDPRTGELHSLIDQVLHQEPLEPLRSHYPEPLFIQEQTFEFEEDFEDIVKSMCKHKNRALNEIQVKMIWELHLGGLSSRQIAREIECDHITAWRVVTTLTKWAKYE